MPAPLPTPESDVDLIRILMEGWDMIEAQAREEFPHATPEELHRICCKAMDRALAKI
jgi:hypothetical protein